MVNHQPINLAKWQQHAWLNRLQSLLLLMVMAGFFALLGWLLWGSDGVIIFLFTGFMGVLLNSFIAPRLVMSLYGARPVQPEHLPALAEVIHILAQRAELTTTPRLYIVPSQILNAFAVGTKNESAIALTDGLLRQLDINELTAVLAHEISHIQNNDLWVMGLADMFSRTTSMFSLFGQILLFMNLPLIMLSEVNINWVAIFLLLFAPNLSALAQLSLSRTREFNADLNAVYLTGDPDSLISALLKIEASQGDWMEHIFIPGRREPVPSVLRTHPPTQERVLRLQSLKTDLEDRPKINLGDKMKYHHDKIGNPVDRPPHWHISGLWH